jgi:hypothetical protein
MAQVGEHLPRKLKILNSNPSTEEEKKKKKSLLMPNIKPKEAEYSGCNPATVKNGDVT